MAVKRNRNGTIGPADYEINLFNSHARNVKTIEDCGWLLMELTKSRIEKSVVIFTDDDGAVLSVENLGIGNRHSVTTYTHVLQASVVANTGRCVWHVHNHPAGTCLPSGQDERFAFWFEDKCRQAGVKYKGSVVVAVCGAMETITQEYAPINFPYAFKMTDERRGQMSVERMSVQSALELNKKRLKSSQEFLDNEIKRKSFHVEKVKEEYERSKRALEWAQKRAEVFEKMAENTSNWASGPKNEKKEELRV